MNVYQGCPFYPDVKPAVYPNEGMPASGSLIYADENSNANQRLEVAEIENKVCKGDLSCRLSSCRLSSCRLSSCRLSSCRLLLAIMENTV